MKTTHKLVATAAVALMMTLGVMSPAMAAKKPMKTMKANSTYSRIISICPPGTIRVAIRYLPGQYVPGMPLYDCV